MILLTIILSSLLTYAARFDIEILETQQTIVPKSSAQDLRPLAWFPKAKKIRLSRKDQKGMIYDTIVNFDSYGHRIVDSQTSSPKKNHLFFSGCSITFGEGVSDEESFPYRLSKEFRDTEIVNMGMRGSGIQDHVYIWSTLDFNSIYKEQEGLMVYTLIPDVFARLGRTWRYLQWAFPYSTVYKEKNGTWVYDGINDDKIDYKWAQWMNSAHLDYWWLRLTNYHSIYVVNESIDPVVEMITMLKEKYLTQFPKGRFVVSWMRNPLLPTQEDYKSFISSLKKARIDFWEPGSYEEIPESVKLGQWHIPRDGHPTAYAHEMYARFLKEKIRAGN